MLSTKFKLPPTTKPITIKPNIVLRKSILNDSVVLANSMHIFAETITTFTMIYCGLNYFYYKKLNDKIKNK